MAKRRKTGGRTAGTPNKITAATRERIESQADPIGFLIAIQKGEAVDAPDNRPTLEQRISAAVSLARRVAPDAKDNPIRLALPTLCKPSDASAAMSKIVEAVGTGVITPSEGSTLAGLVDSYRRVVEIEEIERRLTELEKQVRA